VYPGKSSGAPDPQDIEYVAQQTAEPGTRAVGASCPSRPATRRSTPLHMAAPTRTVTRRGPGRLPGTWQ